ncbi:MAG: hypothetical protein GX601_10550, partial [Anaerolineales bacterium]|nr:hypothetical protein [Anaerolineales bacterium]
MTTQGQAGLRIGKRAFVQSFLILLALMVGAGVLTKVVPAGAYTRSVVDGREIIDPDSFAFIERPA